MAGSFKSFSFIVLLLIIGSIFSNSEARLLVSAGSHEHGSINKGIDIFFDGLFGGIKSGGPSSAGGPKYTDGEILGEIKHSGSTPGQGNYYTTSSSAEILGGIKNSGPSPGQGNSYTTKATQTLGGIKNSGTSPGSGH